MSWKDYSGEEGYHRMIGELRASVSDQFPETQGRVYIFDHLNDTDAEIASAASTLGLTPESLKSQAVAHLNATHRDGSAFPSKTEGLCFSVTRDDGTEVFLAFGANPSGHELTPELIRSLAWHNLHEATHGIQFAKGDATLPPKATDEESGAYKEYIESFAETVSHATLAQHGDEPGWHHQAAANYDYRKIEGGFDSYNPGPTLSNLLVTAPVYAQELESYKLDHLRETYHLAQQHLHLNTPQEIADKECLSMAQAFGSMGMEGQELLTWIEQRRDIFPDAPRILAGHAYTSAQEHAPTDDPYTSPPPENGTIWQSLARAGIQAQQTHSKDDARVFARLLSCTSRDEVNAGRASQTISLQRAYGILQNDELQNLAQRILSGDIAEEQAISEFQAMAIESPNSSPPSSEQDTRSKNYGR